MAIKVTLRQKPISKGRKSLYLDFYPAVSHPETDKLTRRKFLGLYVFEKPNNLIDKQHNADTLQIARQIRQKWENSLNKPEIYNQYEKEQLRLKQLGEQDFIAYFRKLANKRKTSNNHNWISALQYLIDFTNGELKFTNLNEKKLNEFKEYLLTTKSKRSDKTILSRNTAASYFNKVKAALRESYKDGILQNDLNSKVKPIKPAETKREYLTLEELNKLVKSSCKNELLKRAALFSALTGLRFSDIENLVWGEVEYIRDQGYFIKFEQKKTKGVEVLPISEQAYGLLGEPSTSDSKVFDGLKYSAYHNEHLSHWVRDAGVTKKITFHSFRHSYAVLQLSHGTDIYTVSKMLGHRNIKTTQVYAKIVDEAKRKAVDRIKLDM